MYEEAEVGTEFWVPVEYPSRIWRVQKLVAGANGRFFKRGDEWVHHGTWQVAYTIRDAAVADAQYHLRINYNALGKVLDGLIREFKNLGKCITDNYETCKEVR